MKEKRSVLMNAFEDGSSLAAIEVCGVTEDERMYHESEFEHFQYVFTKDNMSTYHQQFDNILHWIWNEYENDPSIYESLEYKIKICNKVFTTINARIFGVLNPDDNHAEIISILDSLVPDVNMFEYVATMRDKLYDRKTVFTQEDAVVWYNIDTPCSDIPFARKPLPIPYIKINDRIIPIGDKLQQFYLAVFRYAIRWYNHLYATKNSAIWLNIGENERIFAVPSKKSVGDELNAPHPDDNITDIISMDNFHKVTDFNLEVGNVLVLNISSENGQFHDRHMEPYCFAFLAHTEEGYFISSQRGYNSYTIENPFDIQASRWVKKWVNTLTSRNRSEEAILTDMWRDIMQSNALLFPYANKLKTSFKLRIINWSKYDKIPLMMEPNDRIISVKDDIAHIMINRVSTLLKIWELLEHTLDLWVMCPKNGMKWGLISNIYKNRYQMYIDKPHIPVIFAHPSIKFNPDEDVVAIIPRDGITYFIDGKEYNFIPDGINGQYPLKSYL